MDITSSNTKGRVFPWRKLTTMLSIGIVVSAIASLLYINFKPYPCFIEGFGNKFKYCLKLPNDKLIDLLYDKSTEAIARQLIVKMRDGCYRPFSTCYDISEFDPNDCYIIVDTVNTKDEIEDDSIYFFIDIFNHYKGDGVWAKNAYDSFWQFSYKTDRIEFNSVLQCSKFDLNKSLRQDEEIRRCLVNIPSSDIFHSGIFISLVGLYNTYGYEYLKLCAKRYPHNIEILEWYLRCLDNFQYDDEEERIANRLLRLDNKNILAHLSLAKLYIRQNEWLEAQRHARMAIDYGGKQQNRGEIGDAHILLAWSLYKQGAYDEALREYRIGCDHSFNNDLIQKYSIGDPFEIKSIQVAFTDSHGNYTTKFGAQLYSKNSQYIKPKITIHKYRDYSDECIQWKLFTPDGTLSRSSSSPIGYTCEDEIFGQRGFDNDIELRGWGNSHKGTWEPGLYRIEIWYKGHKLQSSYFTIY